MTGSAGLIGTALTRALRRRNTSVIGLDLRAGSQLQLDVRALSSRVSELGRVTGIVHLAAVSRVVHGEQNPALCRSVNIDGTREVLDTAARLPLRPWVIFASSREVYGEQSALPVREDAELKPLNVYARSKVEAEQSIWRARTGGVPACIVRFSNVYGSVHDHPDRVVPAFAAAAARGGKLRVDGLEGILDFTHVSDVAAGVLGLISFLDASDRELPPPIHFVSGVPTSLGALAELALEFGSPGTSMFPAQPRNFDVHYFYGDPSGAAALLGWRSSIDIRAGFLRLINDFRAELVQPEEHRI